MKMVFVNFPVSNLARSTAFYAKLGFMHNNDYSSTSASAMVWDEHFCIMLLDYDFYSVFIGGKSIADTKATSAALISFSMPDAATIDEFARTAKENGGSYFHVDMGIPKDHMYSLEVQDPDGNMLEPMWMREPN